MASWRKDVASMGAGPTTSFLTFSNYWPLNWFSFGGFPGGSVCKNLATMRETCVGSLGREDPWRREQRPTPVFWPGEIHGVYSSWGCRESGMTEQLSLLLSKKYLCPICDGWCSVLTCLQLVVWANRSENMINLFFKIQVFIETFFLKKWSIVWLLW